MAAAAPVQTRARAKPAPAPMFGAVLVLDERGQAVQFCRPWMSCLHTHTERVQLLRRFLQVLQSSSTASKSKTARNSLLTPPTVPLADARMSLGLFLTLLTRMEAAGELASTYHIYRCAYVGDDRQLAWPWPADLLSWRRCADQRVIPILSCFHGERHALTHAEAHVHLVFHINGSLRRAPPERVVCCASAPAVDTVTDAHMFAYITHFSDLRPYPVT